jgi:enoyl-[acyl-carrier protein] reductase I
VDTCSTRAPASRSTGSTPAVSARPTPQHDEADDRGEGQNPDRRHIDADDVGAAAAYLLSDEADNVTGTTLYVDSGYHAMGM